MLPPLKKISRDAVDRENTSRSVKNKKKKRANETSVCRELIAEPERVQYTRGKIEISSFRLTPLLLLPSYLFSANGPTIVSCYWLLRKRTERPARNENKRRDELVKFKLNLADSSRERNRIHRTDPR